MSKKSWPKLFNNLLYEKGQDFLDSSHKYGYIDLFEEVDDGHWPVGPQHVEGAELRGLGAAREPVQVQRYRTQEIILEIKSHLNNNVMLSQLPWSQRKKSLTCLKKFLREELNKNSMKWFSCIHALPFPGPSWQNISLRAWYSIYIYLCEITLLKESASHTCMSSRGGI